LTHCIHMVMLCYILYGRQTKNLVDSLKMKAMVFRKCYLYNFSQKPHFWQDSFISVAIFVFWIAYKFSVPTVGTDERLQEKCHSFEDTTCFPIIISTQYLVMSSWYTVCYLSPHWPVLWFPLHALELNNQKSVPTIKKR